MSRFKKILGDIEVTRDLTLLLLIGGLYSLSIALSNTFVNIFLWKQSGEYFDLGLYNLSIVVLQLITFTIAGRWAKKIDRVIVLRIGVIFLGTFYLAVLIAGGNASAYLLLLGALLGVGYGFYWLAFNVLTFEITEPENRDFFNGFLGILNSVAGMAGPIAAGFIISKMEKFTGYSIIFGISLTLFLVAVILSFFLNRRPASGRYWFSRILKERKNSFNWRMITNAHFFQGLREGTFAFLVSVFVFISTGSELALGTFGLVNSGISFVAYYIVSRMLRKHQRKKAILIGGILLYVSIFFILANITFPKLMIYAAIIAVGYPILFVPYVSMTYDVIGTAWKAREMRIEYIVVRELYLNIGRVVSVLAFLAGIAIFKPENSIPVLIIILGTGHTLIYYFIHKVNLAA
ncbi:MFS transporter [Bacillus mesophilum]|uniref:MFS transporter n=1 Tax=Bacillus mesophilum TaxID=1071718 RepID=A0A7V7RN64_9BACI|nr:MFS transporter [Bacillus mesophilum]KAB2333875.1 MFS transporter [Bacillus mesophilum]